MTKQEINDLTMKFLIEKKGFDVNGPSGFGHSVLTNAIVNCSYDTISTLLRAGANPNSRGEDGWTPLHEAAKRGRLDICRLLLTFGADIHRRHSDVYGIRGMDAAQIAEEYDGRLGRNNAECIKWLKEYRDSHKRP